MTRAARIPHVGPAELPMPWAALWLERILAMASIAFGARYLWWRVRDTTAPEAHWFFVLFLGAESLAYLSTLFFYSLTWRRRFYAVPEPIADATVDVFITTYNEPVELLRDTIACAVRM